MITRTRALASVGGLAAALTAVAACAALPPEPVDPAAELPVLVRFVHGHGSEDLLSVGSDGVVVGWLGGQDGHRPVGCLAEASFVRDLAAAAVDGLEQGATEPDRDG
ncbi:MAG TPA: hypothetical protein VES93_11455, partial [Ornithinibacter sp.]|nr:hypothetical protein [Ornithinibacter sp.]